jgi:hypothetical protein
LSSTVTVRLPSEPVLTLYSRVTHAPVLLWHTECVRVVSGAGGFHGSGARAGAVLRRANDVAEYS